VFASSWAYPKTSPAASSTTPRVTRIVRWTFRRRLPLRRCDRMCTGLPYAMPALRGKYGSEIQGEVRIRDRHSLLPGHRRARGIVTPWRSDAPVPVRSDGLPEGGDAVLLGTYDPPTTWQYAERYLGGGTRTYSPYAADLEISPEYHPQRGAARFVVPTFRVAADGWFVNSI